MPGPKALSLACQAAGSIARVLLVLSQKTAGLHSGRAQTVSFNGAPKISLFPSAPQKEDSEPAVTRQVECVIRLLSVTRTMGRFITRSCELARADGREARAAEVRGALGWESGSQRFQDTVSRGTRGTRPRAHKTTE